MVKHQLQLAPDLSATKLIPHPIVIPVQPGYSNSKVNHSAATPIPSAASDSCGKQQLPCDITSSCPSEIQAWTGPPSYPENWAGSPSDHNTSGQGFLDKATSPSYHKTSEPGFLYKATTPSGHKTSEPGFPHQATTPSDYKPSEFGFPNKAPSTAGFTFHKFCVP